MANATIIQCEEFRESQVWLEMREELESWRAAAESEFLVCEGLLQLGRIQGRLEALDYMLALPETVVSIVRERALVQKMNKPEGTDDMDEEEPE